MRAKAKVTAPQMSKEQEGIEEWGWVGWSEATAYRRTRQARESIQPVTSWDTVITFHPMYTRDTWLSTLTWEKFARESTQSGTCRLLIELRSANSGALTFGSDCSRVSLYAFGSRSSCDARGSLWTETHRCLFLLRLLKDLKLCRLWTIACWKELSTKPGETLPLGFRKVVTIIRILTGNKPVGRMVATIFCGDGERLKSAWCSS